MRRLNAEGRKSFEDWLASGAAGTPPPLLESSVHTETLSTQIEVAPQIFATRYDMGEYLLDALNPIGAQVLFDTGVWDWLSLHYIDQICPPMDGARKVQARERYLLTLRNRKWSRHLVRMNWLSVREHGVNARVLLSTPPNGHSEVIEQLAGQQELFGSRPVISAAMSLYWGGTGLKKGAQGKSAGTPRRLRRIMSQLRRTWDPDSMDPQGVLELLPAEFDRWKKTQTA